MHAHRQRCGHEASSTACGGWNITNVGGQLVGTDEGASTTMQRLLCKPGRATAAVWKDCAPAASFSKPLSLQVVHA